MAVPKVLILLVCFLAVSLAATGKKRSGDGTLTLKTVTSDCIEGSFIKGDICLDFISKPGLLTLSVGGNVLLNVLDFGAFLQVHIGGRIFLVVNAPDIVNRIIDITTSTLNLPICDGSSLLDINLNLDIVTNLLSSLSLTNLLGCERRLLNLMVDLSATVELELLVDLSIQLAIHGITGVSHPCSQPLHLCALRLLKIRADIAINLDLDLVVQANALCLPTISVAANVSIPGSCAIVDTCNNANFGQCGSNGNCWSWVCGGCGGFVGCQQQDCGCSCKGATSLACVNLAVTRCTGNFNGCAAPPLINIDLSDGIEVDVNL
jgi:hypothetical protein